MLFSGLLRRPGREPRRCPSLLSPPAVRLPRVELLTPSPPVLGSLPQITRLLLAIVFDGKVCRRSEPRLQNQTAIHSVHIY